MVFIKTAQLDIGYKFISSYTVYLDSLMVSYSAFDVV